MGAALYRSSFSNLICILFTLSCIENLKFPKNKMLRNFNFTYACQISGFYYVFHGRVTLFFANNFLTQRRITMKLLHNFLLDPEVIFSSYTMFINAPTKEFTLRHLVTFSISRSRIRMKFYFVYRLIRLWTKCL